MPIRHCPHCGEAERLVFAEDSRGPILWCQSCFHVSLGGEAPSYCPDFGMDDCRRAEAGDPGDVTLCAICPRRAARQR